MSTTDTTEIFGSLSQTGRGLIGSLRRMVFRKPSLVTGAIYSGVGVILLLTIIGPSIGPWLADAGCVCGWGSEQIDSGHALETPSGTHFFGTDRSGLDVFSRVLAAPRINLVIALAATALSVVIGVPLGLLAGYIGGRAFAATVVSELIMRFMDVLQSFPLFVFAVVLVAVRGQSTEIVVIALTIVNLPVFARLARAEMLTVREQPYSDAARILGHGNFRLIFRHLAPNSVASSVATVPMVIGFVILFTASLSFVGAGVKPPTAELGGMIRVGANNMVTGEWWPSVFPGVALGLMVLIFAFAAQDFAARMRSVKRAEGLMSAEVSVEAG